MNRLKAYLQSEREKMKDYSAGKKLQYIWQYYKLWIIGLVCAVTFGGWFVYHRAVTPADNWFFALYANTRAEINRSSDIYKDFEAYTGYDTKEKNILLNGNSYFEPADTGYNEYYATFVTYVDTGLLDVVTMERDDIEVLGARGRLMDLNLFEDGILLEKYADRIVYADVSVTDDKGNTTESQVPIGIDLSDTCMVTEYGFYNESCALGISAQAPHPEAIMTYLEFVIDRGDE